MEEGEARSLQFYLYVILDSKRHIFKKRKTRKTTHSKTLVINFSSAGFWKTTF